METIFKNCQSCSMPMKTDDKRGTEADGSKSNMYCVHCYEDGKFISPDITLDEMKERVKGVMKGVGIPGFLTGMFTKGIPKLERWKNGNLS